MTTDGPTNTCHCRFCEPELGQGEDLDAIERKVVDDVERFGWHVVMVGADARTRGWSYSIGMWHTFRSPELVIAGLPLDNCARLINDIGELVRAGARLDPSSNVEDLLTSGLSLAVRFVHPSWYRPLFGQALRFSQRPPLPFLQVVWPDKGGHFPWDAEFDISYRSEQPTLWVSADEHPMSPWSGVLAPDPWPFEDPEDKVAVTTKRVVDEAALIQYVHHEPDGDWQFIDDGPTERGHIDFVHLVHVVGANPSIASLADLPRGWMASREAADQPWSRRPFTDDVWASDSHDGF